MYCVLSMRREWEVFMIKYGRSTPTCRDLISGNVILSDAWSLALVTLSQGAHHVKLRRHQHALHYKDNVNQKGDKFNLILILSRKNETSLI